MLGKKFDLAKIITVEVAEQLHDKKIVMVVTDGKFVQLDREED